MKTSIATWAMAWLLPATAMAQPATVTYCSDDQQQLVEVSADVTHAETHVEFFPKDKRLSGEATLTVVPLREDLNSLSFKTYDMVVRAVAIDATAVTFRCENGETVLTPVGKPAFHKPCMIRFEFESPTTHFTYVGWDEDSRGGRQQLWTTKPFGWIPLIHERDLITTDTFITCDQGFQVYANGVRVSVTNNANLTATWHYRMDRPYPVYLTSLSIGNYTFQTIQSHNGTPIELWMYPDKADLSEPTYRHMEQIFNFLETEFGVPYHYAVYRQAPLAEYTVALEIASATVFSERWLTDQRSFSTRNYVNINAHELVHQWFGCSLVHRNDRFKWLSEGFATYYAKMWERNLLGDDRYEFLRLREWERTMQAAERDSYPVSHSKGDDARWYSKGSLVLDMLHDVLGDTEFRAVVRHYLQKHAFSLVETNDLLKAIHETTGRSLEWFFEEWVYRGGEPHYEVSYVDRESEAGQRNTHIRVRQIHETGSLIGLFRMPVAFEVAYRDGTLDRRTEWIADQSQEVVVPNPDKREIAYVLFDPGRRVLKKVTFPRNAEELLAQARDAARMIDRYDALVTLREAPVASKRAVLHACFRREAFHLNKSEIISQLAADPESQSLLKEAIRDPDALVRLAVLENVRRVPESLREPYEQLLADSSYDNVALALENLCGSFPQRTEGYLTKTQGEIGVTGRNVRIKWLEMSMLQGRTACAEELVAYASPRYDYQTRINAMQALKRINRLDESAARNLLLAYLHGNSPVHKMAGDTLCHFHGQQKYEAMLEECVKKGKWSAEEMKQFDGLWEKHD